MLKLIKVSKNYVTTKKGLFFEYDKYDILLLLILMIIILLKFTLFTYLHVYMYLHF